MKTLALEMLLVADRSVFRDLGSGFRTKRDTFAPSDLIPWVVVTVIVLAALGIISRVIARREKQAFDTPRALFRELARAHGLDFASRRLLKRIARTAGLKQPAWVFLEPRCFEPKGLPQDLQAQWPQIEALRARIFAQVPTTAKANGAN